jgi:hypothetical protein
MKIVPQSDPSDITEPTSPDVKQNTRNEEEVENNPSPNEAVVVSEKVPDNDGGAMKVPRRSSTMQKKLKNGGEFVFGYMYELMNTQSIDKLGDKHKLPRLSFSSLRC